MAFFEKLNDLAKSFGEKTNDVIETGKLNAKVTSERNAAGEALKKVGEYYYDLFAAGKEVAPEVLEFCQTAQEHYAAAAEAQSEIERIQAEKEAAKAEAEAREAAQAAAVQQSSIECPGCGTPNAPGMKFCSNCGTRLTAPVPAGILCTECGTQNSSGTRFCRECGNKLETPAPRLCPGCGVETPENTRFCPQCGYKLQ